MGQEGRGPGSSFVRSVLHTHTDTHTCSHKHKSTMSMDPLSAGSRCLVPERTQRRDSPGSFSPSSTEVKVEGVRAKVIAEAKRSGTRERREEGIVVPSTPMVASHPRALRRPSGPRVPAAAGSGPRARVPWSHASVGSSR